MVRSLGNANKILKSLDFTVQSLAGPRKDTLCVRSFPLDFLLCFLDANRQERAFFYCLGECNSM